MPHDPFERSNPFIAISTLVDADAEMRALLQAETEEFGIIADAARDHIDAASLDRILMAYREGRVKPYVVSGTTMAYIIDARPYKSLREYVAALRLRGAA